MVPSAAPVTRPNDRYKEAWLYGSERSERVRHWEGSGEQANVAAAIKAGLAADTETIAAVETWKQQVGV